MALEVRPRSLDAGRDLWLFRTRLEMCGGVVGLLSLFTNEGEMRERVRREAVGVHCPTRSIVNDFSCCIILVRLPNVRLHSVH